jgi:hypothetical protein
MRSAVTTTTATLGQAVPPLEGRQFGSLINNSDPGGPSYDIIMPLTVSQCDPVLIYYNITAWNAANGDDPALFLSIYSPELYSILNIELPSSDVGYLAWTCNIPAGEYFFAFSQGGVFVGYAVQPGSSSACLGPLTTYTSLLQYDTGIFASYIAASHTSITLPSDFASAYVFPSSLLVYSSTLLEQLHPFLRASFRPSPSSANFPMVDE